MLFNEIDKELSFGRSRLVHPVVERLLFKMSIPVDILCCSIMSLSPWIHKKSWMVIEAVKHREIPPDKIAYGAICRLLTVLACIGVFGNPFEVVGYMHLSR
jgi:hypothetical protein